MPENVYVRKLEPKHIPLVNELWPYHHKNSDVYLETLADMGGGYGLFLKEKDTLVSWIFKNHLGILGILQTVEEYKRRGFGSLMIKFLAKLLAEEGIDPVTSVSIHNTASKNMMRKIGFEEIHNGFYVHGNWKC